VQLEKYSEAEQLCNEALVADRKRGPAESGVLADTLAALGEAYFFDGDLVKAEPAMRETLGLREQSLGMHHALTALALDNLGVLLYQSGRYDEALKVYEQALPIHREIFGSEHPEMATILNNIGRVALITGRIDEAEPLLRSSLAMVEKFEGENHVNLVPRLNSLAMIDAYRKHAELARREIERAASIARVPGHGELLDQVVLNEADIEFSLGDRAHAAVLLAEARELLQKAHPENPTEEWRYAVWNSVNAQLLAANGDIAGATATLSAARTVLVKRFGDGGFYSVRAKQLALQMASARKLSVN
jgi:tetratricopeptide (TPR) repeat protein